MDAATMWQRELGKPRSLGSKPRRKRAKRRNITTARFFTIMMRGLEGSLWVKLVKNDEYFGSYLDI